MRLDPVLLEILHSKVQATAEEMGTTLQRTARTLFVKEAADFATALVGLDGKLFAHPRTNGVSLFVDCDCKATIEAVPDLEPGDVIITNDAFTSGGLSTHLPDLHVIQPYFHDGRIVAYGWAFIHSTDVGGVVPGSILPSNSEYFQEGLIIPPMKFMAKGEMNEDFLTVFKANCRIPHENMGDIRAMLAGLHIGKQRVAEMIERHGLDAFLACHEDLQEYAALKAREVLRKIPDGTYDFWDYMDDDLVTPLPIKVRVKMIVKDGHVHLDLTGTDPQVAASYNTATMNRMHEWLTMRFTSFLMTHDKTLPLNAGLYRHLTMTNPSGTVLNAEYPAAIGLRSAPARRLNDATTGALFKAVPDMTPAPSCGAGLTFVLSEYDETGSKKNVVVVEPMRGGMGAWKGHDGADNRDASMSNMRNHPIENIEVEAGILVREYDIRPDSGGAGEWRGGVGQYLTVEFLRNGGKVYARGMERFRFPAWSVAGGKPAAPFRSVLNLGKAGQKELGKINEVPVNAGDTVTFMMPGAGGYGDPFERDPRMVERDVTQGFVSEEVAKRDYGVVMREGRVNTEATRAERARRIKDNVRAQFDFGPNREAWESVFDDETVSRLNALLFTLPKSIRQARRKWIYSQAVPDLEATGGKPLTEVFKDPDAIRARLKAAMAEVFGAAAARA
jgi:N-methylhydantoinase B